tara:strand:- start:50146 stop:50787 length:642 start_codon:yes stop_codon:yes gene_type:complete
MATKRYDENVFVIPRELFDQLGAFHGFCPRAGDYLPTILSPENNQFLDRNLAEDDPGFKQIIPYAIFRHEDRYLHYVRGGGGGEKRLAAKGSIGIGGHVNEDDYHASGSMGRELYLAGVERETNEELRIESGHTQQIIGLINDDTNEVGQVHLGIVHLFDLEIAAVEANEADITELEFLSREELIQRLDRLESWSSLIVESLDEVLEANLAAS